MGTKMMALFAEADTTADGLVHKEEFLELMHDEQVDTWLQAMDLFVRDPELTFHYLSGEDGMLSMDELVKGVSRLKGPALSLDMVTHLAEVISHQQRQGADLQKLKDAFELGLAQVSARVASLTESSSHA